MAVKKPVETTEDPWEDGTKGDALILHTEDPNREFLTVTLKAGTGYDAPWLVFHANSVEEALESLQHDQLDELMDLTARKGKELAKAFGGSTGYSKPAGSTSSGYKKPAAKQAVSEPDEAPECDHGERNWVTGRSAKGPWYAWMCPADKNDRSKCDPMWANKDGSVQDR